MRRFDALAYNSAQEMMFGRTQHPVRCGFGVEIGNGAVYPEINYTLPPMHAGKEQLEEILKQYHNMVETVLQRLVTLNSPGAVLEFEHAPQMTEDIEIGVRVSEQTKQLMQQFYDRHGLKTAFRVTICDIRDKIRPPQMRTGKATEIVLDSFRQNARAGADLLSIESTGGKEVSDKAILEADIPGLLFALGVLAPRDMHFLWKNIVEIANAEGSIAAGDTACGFANTAMVLADKGYIPNVLAAVVRAMASVRSLVAYEEGAVGPSKDCAYEGPVIKAITGMPISMEGKSASCAHFSHMGNIASAVCDLWSNESVQNVRLLSGFAPEVFTEILVYDCRLMNKSLQSGNETALRDLMIDSDEFESVHSFIISPSASFQIAKAIVEEKSDYLRTHRAASVACELIRDASQSGKLQLPERELSWLGRIEDALATYPDEPKILEFSQSVYQHVFLSLEYAL